ncbi:hypothetical protein GCM10027020_20160 [Nocardioides salsibiostraticola]
MRSRRPPSEHEEAVSRRLAQLSAELAASRVETVPAPEEDLPGSVAPAVGGEWWSDHTRISAARAPLVLVPEATEGSDEFDAAEPSDEALPGRHSSRTPRTWSAFFPETLQGRVTLQPAHLTSVAVIIAMAMALTSWWLVRGDAREVVTGPVANAPAPPLVDLPEEPAAAPAAAPAPGEPPVAGTTSPTTTSPATTAATVTVDVAGKVRRPGIAVLDTGSRVIDAVKAAGGAKQGVNLTSINLARILIDGEQIVVGARAAPAPAPTGTTASGGAGPTVLVNLNLAGQTELETLPQIGPVTAASIITWREQNGGFTAVEELLEVDGIGEKTLAQIAPYATV